MGKTPHRLQGGPLLLQAHPKTCHRFAGVAFENPVCMSHTSGLMIVSDGYLAISIFTF